MNANHWFRRFIGSLDTRRNKLLEDCKSLKYCSDERTDTNAFTAWKNQWSLPNSAFWQADATSSCLFVQLRQSGVTQRVNAGQRKLARIKYYQDQNPPMSLSLFRLWKASSIASCDHLKQMDNNRSIGTCLSIQAMSMDLPKTIQD